MSLNDVCLESVLTCPEGGHGKQEAVPTDACQWFYECERFRTVRRPKHYGAWWWFCGR